MPGCAWRRRRWHRSWAGWEVYQVQQCLGRRSKAEGSKALIPVVKKFMKTCPVIEMAGVQRGPAGAQLCDWEIVRLGCEQSSLATDELYLIRWCLLTSLPEKGPCGVIFMHLTLMTSTVS